MCPMIQLSNATYSRLEELATGFDTPSSVIERLIDQHGEKRLPENSDMTAPRQNGATNKVSTRLFTNKEIQSRISEVAQGLSTEELDQLGLERASKELFNLSFPLFVTISTKATKEAKRAAVKSSDGVSRWTWKFEFERDGFLYAVCTQWYPKNDKSVQQWLESHE
jgi:hypothetical protein